MPFQAVCATCSIKVKVRDDLIGKAIRCPKCGQRLSAAAPPSTATEALQPASAELTSAKPACDLPDPTESVLRGVPDITTDQATDALGTPASNSAKVLVATASLSIPAAEATADDRTSIPHSLGGYRIVRVLGQGGMGAVYEAEDPTLDRRVALKVMKPEIARNAGHRERFLREARTAARVKSEFICPIYRVGEDGDVPFIAMPLLKGEPLDVHRRLQERLPIAEVVRIGKEVAQGLSVAHQAGLVHRDIKPANIWLETQRSGPPRAVILDFGLARMEADDALITQSGAIVGTPAFMSPEQARGDKNVEARTDLFSLGCVLYTLCTGQSPFQGQTTMAVLMALASQEPTPPRQIVPEMPKALSRLIMRLLAKPVDERPQTAQEVIDELAAIEAGLSRPADGLFTTQAELTHAKLPLPPGPSDAACDPPLPRAEPTMLMHAPPSRPRFVFARYVVVSLLSLGAIGCTFALAAGLVYYSVFAGADQAKDAGPQAAAPEPTGDVPPGWVVVARSNYTVAMPKAPTIVGSHCVAQLPNGLSVLTLAYHAVRAQVKQAGSVDEYLDQKMALQLVLNGALKPGTVVPQRAPIALGPCPGRQIRLQAQPNDINHGRVDHYLRAYLIDDSLVILVGPAQGLDPAPETIAFFNSLKRTTTHPVGPAEAKLPVYAVGAKLELPGTLDAKTPEVVYRVKLLARTGYVIDMVSPNPNALDPVLILTDVGGNILATDDDSGGNQNARLLFRPDKSGTYRIVAGYCDNGQGGAGPFTLTVRTDALGLNDSVIWLQQAALEAWHGQEKDYAATRRRILALARNSKDGSVAERAAKACSLRPGADAADLDAALALARQAVARKPTEGYCSLALGMAAYRKGDDMLAQQALMAASKEQRFCTATIAGFYRAMSLFREGKRDAARTVALEAAATMKPLPRDNDIPLAGGADADDLIAWMAYREARALIQFHGPP